MKDIVINVNNKTGNSYLNNANYMISQENLQRKIIVKFTEKFVDGIAYLMLKKNNETRYIPMQKNEKLEQYELPIKSSIMSDARYVEMNIRIMQDENEDGIPIFVSTKWIINIKETINSDKEIPEEYPLWIDLANAKITEIDNSIKEAKDSSEYARKKANEVADLKEDYDKNAEARIVEYNQNVKEQNKKYFVVGKNKFNYENLSENKTINNSGQIINSQYKYLLSDKIYIEDNENIVISYVTSSKEQILVNNATIAFYDSDNHFISKLYGSKIEVPDSAYYCYCLLSETYSNGDNRERIQLEFNNEMTSFEKFYIELNKNIKISKVTNIRDVQREITLKEINQIKIIGDSITQGVGGTGFIGDYGDGDTFLIVDELDTSQGGRKFKVNTVGHCWTNSFKEYIESKFNITVKNYGNRGMSAGRWINMGHTDENGIYKKCIEQLIEDNDDLVICMIGTNDRTYDTYDNYVIALHQIIDYVVNIRKKQLILLSSVPASVENETNGSQKFHMEDVDNIVTALANKNHILSISLYKEFTKYCNLKNIEIDSLLSDGLHPNDIGYDVMFQLICEKLEIGTKREGASW